MDPRLLSYYNRELQHIRDMGAEFAREFPKIAGRLGMEDLEVADPYVERLLEGFAFLAARVQLKVDAEFPRFTQHLMAQVLPHYLAPTPSMLIAQFQPDLSETGLADGLAVPRGTVLRSQLGRGEQTACEYRTAHPLRLWPLSIEQAEYLGTAAAVKALGVAERPGLRAGIRLRLKLHGDLTFAKLPLDNLTLYLRGAEELPVRLYEQLIANAITTVALPPRNPPPWQQPLGSIRQLGFDDDQALLAFSPRSFQGYRLLAEYFAFPQRFLFVEFTGLRRALARCTQAELELVVLLNRADSTLEGVLSGDNFALHCSPAVNLFPKRTDRIRLGDHRAEHHVVVDRTRPMDFEIYRIDEVIGHGSNADQEQRFRPFYAAPDEEPQGRAFYTLHRVPRLMSSKQRRVGPRSSYVGSEVFINLVDAEEAPYRSELRQLALTALCTNRDLPLHLPVGRGDTDFTIESGLPVQSVRCLSGPSKPRPSPAEKDVTWRLISHLTLNYLSLLDGGEAFGAPAQGAAALRELLLLYVDPNDSVGRKQIEDGLRSVSHRQLTRRLPLPGPIAFGRGLGIDLTLEETAFAGSGAFLLGAVVERFFAKYVALNTFTETTVHSENRGELIRWPARIGLRHTL